MNVFVVNIVTLLNNKLNVPIIKECVPNQWKPVSMGVQNEITRLVYPVADVEEDEWKRQTLQ
jgi:hypothetical protein